MRPRPAWANLTHCVAAGLLVGNAALGQAPEQAKRTAPGSDAVRSWVVPEGEVRGIVIDADSGEPVEGAQVFAMETQVGALTDSRGRFVLRGLPRGTYVIAARSSGYVEARVSIDMVPQVGWAARFSLHRSDLRNCGLVVCGDDCGSVAVHARDAMTGLAPTVPVALRVSRGSDRYWDFATGEPGDSVIRVAAGRGSGPFAVEVAAAGYEPWYVDEVIVELDECGGSRSDPLHAWLLQFRTIDP